MKFFILNVWENIKFVGRGVRDIWNSEDALGRLEWVVGFGLFMVCVIVIVVVLS